MNQPECPPSHHPAQADKFRITRMNTHLNNLDDILIQECSRSVHRKRIKLALIFIAMAAAVASILWASPLLLHQLAFASLLRPSTVTSHIFEDTFPSNLSHGVVCSGSPCTITDLTISNLSAPSNEYIYITIINEPRELAQLVTFVNALKKHSNFPLLCATFNHSFSETLSTYCDYVKILPKYKATKHRLLDTRVSQEALAKLDLFNMAYDLGFKGFTYIDYYALLMGSLDKLFSLIDADQMKHSIYTASLDSEYGNAFLTMSDFNLFTAPSTKFSMRIIFERWFVDIKALPGAIPIRENNIYDYFSTFFSLYLSSAFIPPHYSARDELEHEANPIYYHMPSLKKILDTNCDVGDIYKMRKYICLWKSQYISNLKELKHNK